jgi:hypothetical protein
MIPSSALEQALADLEGFTATHGDHDGWDVDAERLSDHGYRLTSVCGCGARLDRWITRRDAADALAL